MICQVLVVIKANVNLLDFVWPPGKITKKRLDKAASD